MPFPLHSPVVCVARSWRSPSDLPAKGQNLPEYGKTYHVRGYGDTASPPELYLDEIRGEIRSDGSEVGFNTAGFAPYQPPQRLEF
jgi:hypothetical protein